MKSRILLGSLALSLLVALVAGSFLSEQAVASEKAATAKVTFSIPGMS